MNAQAPWLRVALGGLAVLALTIGLAACGGGGSAATTATAQAANGTTLPGTGKPEVTIGDKNFTEQFVLGELYQMALTAQGYQVALDRNIGPPQVSFPALTSDRLAMYPEYLNIWDSSVAGYRHGFPSAAAAYRAAQHFAHQHGLALLRPTAFSDTDAIAVTTAYARAHHLDTLDDLARVAAGMTLGAPAEFQQSPNSLPALEQTYRFTPETVSSLDVGAQYQALTQGSIQAAYATTTDGELTGHSYRVLADPRNVFGYGNAVPVVPAKVLAAEGPAFARTIDAVSALLTTRVMRELNAEVDLQHQDPAVVAKQFLQEHGLVPPSPS